MPYADPENERLRSARRRARDPEGHAAYMREWYKRNPTKRAQYDRKRRAAVHAVKVAAKRGPCADCGLTFPSFVMDFDHVGPKRFNIARDIGTRTAAAVKAEIAQCEVVCSNCHRIRTHYRRVGAWGR